ncbi:MAG: Na/Pi cotransporter family protein [Clostridiales bacterium]|nr:Na/Pi cotransporter family protein [Clostridiales bacterium]
MSILSILSFLGGLALFLYGMNVMSTSLERTAGGKLEHTLQKFTDKPLKGVLLGFGVTAVIQSSSAVSVMVVGFVNSGLMQLSQAVGVLMGTKIGTTVTAWILSLSGVEGNSIWATLFKPSSFSPIFAFIGIMMIMFAKKDKLKNIGSILMGFGVLMFGMTMMTSAVEPLKDSQAFTTFCTNFSNPVLGVFAGVIMTMAMQSSSAAVGILQALSLTGSITFQSAFPLILGLNIGTCTTAVISSLGASKNAKRTSIMHVYISVIGAVFFLAAFYILNAIFKFEFVFEKLNPVMIATIHSVFNILTTILLFPFSKLIVKLAEITVKDKKGSDENRVATILDERFLKTPAFAIEQCRQVANEMAELAKNNLFLAISVVNKYDEKLAKTIEENEEKIDAYEDSIGNYLVKLNSKKLTKRDSNETSKILHSIGDFERIGDHASNLLDVAREINDKGISFSAQAKEELEVITSALKEILNNSISAFVKDDSQLASTVEPLEEVIDTLHERLKRRHIERLKNNECTIELGFIFSDLLTNYERVSDHCSNIAICVIQSKDNTYDPHEYLNNLGEDNREFAEEIQEYKEKYALPARENK